MKQSKPYFQCQMFVCVRKRDNGKPNCAERGSEVIRDQLKAKCKDLELRTKVRISKSGCQDLCARGPNIHIMPQNIWLSGVKSEDIDEIVSQFIKPD